MAFLFVYLQIAVMYQKVHDGCVYLFLKNFWDGIWNGDHVRGGGSSVLGF